MSSAEPSRVLVLWDVDHTLIETRGVGSAIYRRAFAEATGRPLGELADVSGRTELDIMREMLRINGVEATDEAVGALAAALTEGYDDARDELVAAGRALPGAEATLRRLADDPRIHQSVLTGNLRAIARIKLDVFGLTGYLDLDVGAYGEDHADRAHLVGIAQQRASEHTGVAVANSCTILLGDTPNDVRAAATAGVRVIGVATGKHGPDDLIAAGAPAVLIDLTDPDRAAALILDPSGTG